MKLPGGHIRWFRVFAINAENDGAPATGGTARQVSDGEPQADPATEASPNAVDITSAEPKYGMTGRSQRSG